MKLFGLFKKKLSTLPTAALPPDAKLMTFEEMQAELKRLLDNEINEYFKTMPAMVSFDPQATCPYCGANEITLGYERPNIGFDASWLGGEVKGKSYYRFQRHGNNYIGRLCRTCNNCKAQLQPMHPQNQVVTFNPDTDTYSVKEDN